jgi:hypothetical protein
MEWMNVLNKFAPVWVPAVSVLLGYLVGSAKFFRESKHKAYQELLPPMVRMVYNPESADEAVYNQALMKLWLYGKKGVAKKMDFAVACILDPSRGDATKALQEAISKMRADIQLLWWQRIPPEDIEHLFLRIPARKAGASGQSNREPDAAD